MKYSFIIEHATNQLSVARFCGVPEVSRAGYYEWLNRKPSMRAQFCAVVDGLIKAVHEKCFKAYGGPREHRALRNDGVRCRRTTVESSVLRQGLESNYDRRFRPQTTDSKNTKTPAGNALNQEFTASAPNPKWVSAITFIPTIAGWVYLCVVLDLFSRKVVG